MTKTKTDCCTKWVVVKKGDLDPRSSTPEAVVDITSQYEFQEFCSILDKLRQRAYTVRSYGDLLRRAGRLPNSISLQEFKEKIR